MRLRTLKSVVLCALVCTAVRGAETKPKEPIRVKSLAQLARLLHLHKPQHLNKSVNNGTLGPNVGTGTIVGAPTIATNAPAAAGTNASAADFSATNVQVAGVDEADFVKTDGEYIYQIAAGKVFVIHATPPTQITLTSSVDLGSEFYPIDLYVQGNRLVVTGTHFSLLPVQDPPADGSPGVSAGSTGSGTLTGTVTGIATASPIFSGPETQVLIFDTSDKANLKQIRKIGIDGNLVASRRIDNFVYLVTSVYPEFVMELAGVSNSASTLKGKTKSSRKKRTAASYVPLLRDTAKSNTLQPLPLENIFVFPNFSEPDFMTLAAFDIQDPTSPVDVKAYLGASQNVYSSLTSLYVQASHFYPVPLVEPDQPQPPANGSTTKPATPARILKFDVSSTIYKFALKSGTVSYTAQANVPGQVLNSFSMDESGGYFRVATTSHVWQPNQSSGVYVFDAQMQLAGKVENIAPSEQIFSARFLGNRAYLVTFHRVDPLFVIDLSLPATPTVLGQVVLSGVSDYLQPFDDSHLIGIGSNTDAAGRLTGLKLALFDVSDPAHPAELSSVVVDNGSSEVQFDHRALLLDPARHLLALPVTRFGVTSNGNGGTPEPVPLVTTVATSVPNVVLPIIPFMTRISSWAQIYDISLEHGFVLRKEVGAPLQFDVVHRVLSIGSSLYVISDQQTTVLDFGSLDTQGTLILPIYIGGGGTPLNLLQVQF